MFLYFSCRYAKDYFEIITTTFCTKTSSDLNLNNLKYVFDKLKTVPIRSIYGHHKYYLLLQNGIGLPCLSMKSLCLDKSRVDSVLSILDILFDGSKSGPSPHTSVFTHPGLMLTIRMSLFSMLRMRSKLCIAMLRAD